MSEALSWRASDVRASALEVQDALLGKVKELSSSGNPATREELLNAILHYFLSVGVDEEEVGDYHLIRCRILLSSVLDMQRMDQFLSNLVGSSLKRLAGSTSSHLPLTYMIVEIIQIIYGKTLPAGSQGNRGEFPDSA